MIFYDILYYMYFVLFNTNLTCFLLIKEAIIFMFVLACKNWFQRYICKMNKIKKIVDMWQLHII